MATGSDPIVPPVPGLRELEGVWGTREATGMKAVPRRLLVLGGGSAGVEIAQVVRRLGGEAVLIEGADRVLPREPAPLGEALGVPLRRDGIELMLGMHAAAARREGEEYVLQFDCGRELRGDRLLVATGRRPRVEGIGLETAGVEAGPHGIPVDEHLRASERLWAIGDVNGIWPLTQWMQQATLAIRAHVPLEVLGDTIQPFPSFSGTYDAAVTMLRMQIEDMLRPARPMDARSRACRSEEDGTGLLLVSTAGDAVIGRRRHPSEES